LEKESEAQGGKKCTVCPWKKLGEIQMMKKKKRVVAAGPFVMVFEKVGKKTGGGGGEKGAGECPLLLGESLLGEKRSRSQLEDRAESGEKSQELCRGRKDSVSH